VRTRCAVLLAWLAAALVGFVLAPIAIGAGPSPATGSAYPWVQPWAIHGVVAPDVGHWTQPPASVMTCPVEQAVAMQGPDASYPWVQPWELRGGAAPSIGSWTQPPASVLTR
jgi:hypothetical protein